MLTPFSLRLGEADTAASFDILNLIVANGDPCNNITVGASLWATLFFPAAHMTRLSNMRAAIGFKSQKLAFSFKKVVKTGPNF